MKKMLVLLLLTGCAEEQGTPLTVAIKCTEGEHVTLHVENALQPEIVGRTLVYGRVGTDSKSLHRLSKEEECKSL